MDDGSDRASVILAKEENQGKSKTLVILASLLILLGAGCTSRPTVKNMPEPTAAVPASSSAEVSDVTGLCYSAEPTPPSFPETGIMSTMAHFLPADYTDTFDREAEDLLPKLQELYRNGWNISSFCVTTVDGQRVAYFSLYAFYGDALSAQPTKTLADNGEKSKALTRLGYSKGGSLALSDPIALGHEDGEAVNLLYQLAYPANSSVVEAKASGFHWMYDINFDPATLKLSITKSN